MNYLSVCSGIEAATMAWHPLGWRPVGFAEVDKFPSAVLNHHYPDVPNFGDMTKFESWPDANVDVLVGGTPCQSFSVAGLRGGLDDARGNLMLVYAAIAQRYRPAWVAWENVPGVLSDDGGRGFASLLGLLAGRRVEVPSGGWESAGVVEGYKGAYGLAWRVLDAQFVRVDGFGRAVPQRRRRVFVVGYLGDWRRAAAVLFESESLRGDPAPRRQTGKGFAQPVAGCLGGSSQDGGFRTTDLDNQGAFIPEVSPPPRSGGNETGGHRPHGTDADTVHSLIPEVANPLTARMFKGVNTTMDEGQTMIGEPFSFKPSHFTRGKDGAPPLTAEAGRTGKGDSAQAVMTWASSWVVRRLTPRECERLQGFPDDFTNIPWRGKNGAPDGPRYKVLGNSMAVNVMRWLGWRIKMVDRIARQAA